MGTALNDLSPASTADTLLKTNLEGPLTTTITQICDGAGNNSPLYLATDKIGFNEAVDMTKTSTQINDTVDFKEAITKSTAEINDLLTETEAATTYEPKKGTDDNFVTDAEKVKLGNLSGTNTGDQDLSSYATKAYADALVVGLIDDRGNFTPSGSYPSSGGSGTAGAILKGDLWTVAGLGSGVTALVGTETVSDGDLVRALVDSPSQTNSNWAVTQNNIGYVAENASNKDTDGSLAANSDTKYASQKAVKTYVDSKVDDTAYNATSWDGVTDKAASKNAVRDKFVSVDSAIAAISGSVEVLSTATIGTTTNNYSTGMNTSKNILTILNIIPSASFKITGIDSTGVENGKRIRIYNQSDRLTSSSRFILFERLFSGSGSTAKNRFMFPLYNGMPLMLMPDSFVEFQYNTFDNYWHMVFASDWGNPNGFFDCYSDCHANAPFIPTTATAGTVGTTSSSQDSATAQKTIGTMLHTITTNAGRAYLGTQQGAMFLGSYAMLGMARVEFTSLADATNDYVSYNLFTDASGGSTPVDACSFIYNRSVSTDWRTQTITGGNEVLKTVTGFTPSTSVFQYIGCFINGDASNVDFFYSNDGDTWTFATSHTNSDVPNNSIPSGTSKTVGFMTGFTKTAGSGSKTMNTDWLGYKLMMKRGV